MTGTTTWADKNSYSGGAWHLAALLGGNVALALGPWLVRLTDTGPVAAGFWRMLLPLPLFAFLAWRGWIPKSQEAAIAGLPGELVGLVVVAGIGALMLAAGRRRQRSA